MRTPDANEIARTRGPGALRDAFDDAVSKANGKAGEGRPKEATKTDAEQSPDWWRTKLIKASDLCDQQFPSLKYVVPGIIAEGVTLLVSRPKLGKSWALLQVGTAVATGVVALVPDDNPLHGDVLYLALEDNPRRLQRRLTKYFGRDRRTWPSRLIIVTEWKRLDQGGLEAIEAWCRSVDKPTLIMIDTLKKVRAPKRNGQSDYDADYEACQGLQQLAGTLNVAIIVAHHDRKMDANEESKSICLAVFNAIRASHLNSFDPAVSVRRKFTGTLKHRKEGIRDHTSLWLFRDDVERLLRDLYGDIEDEALDNILYAVLTIAEEFTRYVRPDLWKEYQDAETADWGIGIGLPEGYGINGSMWRQGLHAQKELGARIHEVRADPARFSDYTVEFVNWLAEEWPGLAQPWVEGHRLS